MSAKISHTLARLYGAMLYKPLIKYNNFMAENKNTHDTMPSEGIGNPQRARNVSQVAYTIVTDSGRMFPYVSLKLQIKCKSIPLYNAFNTLLS